jgi:DsbC/DsbD-like thiol-disulfide interchange protein
MMPLKSVTIIFLLSLAADVSSAQRAPVSWSYAMHRISGHEWIFTTTATLAPGWHIYSQHLGEGGPIPTRITLNPNDDYSLIGTAEEKGKAFHFYDSLYEMNIIRYSGEVSFLQRISMNCMPPEIRGTIEYMVCNNKQCVPHQEQFTVNVHVKN